MENIITTINYSYIYQLSDAAVEPPMSICASHSATVAAAAAASAASPEVNYSSIGDSGDILGLVVIYWGLWWFTGVNGDGVNGDGVNGDILGQWWYTGINGDILGLMVMYWG